MATRPRSAVSADGGTVSFFQIGAHGGPGVIVLHGILQTWRSYRDVGEDLAASFTVYLVDRRGRGQTAAAGADYAMATELADLEAVAAATGARFVFGISSGALIALQAALARPGLFDRVALWEPPAVVDRVVHDELLARVTEQIGRGDVAAALLTNMDMTDSAPLWLYPVPRFVLRPVVAFLISLEWRDGYRPGETDPPATLLELGPTMLYDLKLLKEMDGPVERFAPVGDAAEVLLLSGTASVAFFRRSCDELKRVVPGARLKTFKGLVHLGAANSAVGGSPGAVGKALRAFFRGD